MIRQKKNRSVTVSPKRIRATQCRIEIPDRKDIEENFAVSVLLGRLRVHNNSARPILKGAAERILCEHGMTRAQARETLETEANKGRLWRSQKASGGDGRGDPYEIVLSSEYVFPDEVDRAVSAWWRIFGHKLDPRRVKEHISNLRKWEGTRGRTR